VSKRIDAPSRSGPSKSWLKTKNPKAAPILPHLRNQPHAPAAHRCNPGPPQNVAVRPSAPSPIPSGILCALQGCPPDGPSSLGPLVPLSLCITNAVVFGQSSSTTLIDRGLDSPTGLAHHLDAHRRIAAGGQLRSLGRHTRPEFEPKVSDARGANGYRF
jgi:hypothetical protein